jgi:hypothetical protein
MTINLYKCWSDLPDPVLATKDLSGEVPSRALRFCEPFLVSNCAGFLVNAPVNVDLFWTGSEILARFEDISETVLVDRLFLPDQADHWQSIARAGADNVLPPFLEAFPEHGVAQIWSGLFVTTPPGVACWIRGPVNRESGSGHAIVEGVIETDWWTGPLFSVIKFLKTDFPIRLSRAKPFLQILPVNVATLRPDRGDINTQLVQDAPDAFWTDMVSTATRRNTAAPGSYRREAVVNRKRS